MTPAIELIIFSIIVAVGTMSLRAGREVPTVALIAPVFLIIFFPQFGALNGLGLAISATFVTINIVRFFPWGTGVVHGMRAELIVAVLLLQAMLFIDVVVPDGDPSQPVVLKTLGVLLALTVAFTLVRVTLKVFRTGRNGQSHAA